MTGRARKGAAAGLPASGLVDHEHVNAPALALYRKIMRGEDTEEAMSVFTYELEGH